MRSCETCIFFHAKHAMNAPNLADYSPIYVERTKGFLWWKKSTRELNRTCLDFMGETFVSHVKENCEEKDIEFVKDFEGGIRTCYPQHVVNFVSDWFKWQKGRCHRFPKDETTVRSYLCGEYSEK